jgi:hypothetical protein
MELLAKAIELAAINPDNRAAVVKVKRYSNTEQVVDTAAVTNAKTLIGVRAGDSTYDDEIATILTRIYK